MASLFRPAIDLLKQYAEYHRDRRNIVTHFVGVPMIVFAVGVLLAGVSFTLGGLAVTPAWMLFGLVALWYLTRGQLALGAATTLGMGLLVLLAHRVGGGAVGPWLAWSVGFFVSAGSSSSSATTTKAASRPSPTTAWVCWSARCSW
jgi:uncharacterized membrane protein YGL010W